MLQQARLSRSCTLKNQIIYHTELKSHRRTIVKCSPHHATVRNCESISTQESQILNDMHVFVVDFSMRPVTTVRIFVKQFEIRA